MKINVEVEIEPEEMRRLLGLPDAQPFWDAINERVASGDMEMTSELLKTFIGDSLKNSEILGRFTRGFSMFKQGEGAKTKAAKQKAKPAARKKAASKKA